jgi:hypothetical protein
MARDVKLRAMRNGHIDATEVSLTELPLRSWHAKIAALALGQADTHARRAARLRAGV